MSALLVLTTGSHPRVLSVSMRTLQHTPCVLIREPIDSTEHNLRDLEASGALDVHEERVGLGDDLLELVGSGVNVRGSVEEVDSESLSVSRCGVGCGQWRDLIEDFSCGGGKLVVHAQDMKGIMGSRVEAREGTGSDGRAGSAVRRRTWSSSPLSSPSNPLVRNGPSHDHACRLQSVQQSLDSSI